jgi:hypothetical protein
MKWTRRRCNTIAQFIRRKKDHFVKVLLALIWMHGLNAATRPSIQLLSAQARTAIISLLHSETHHFNAKSTRRTGANIADRNLESDFIGGNGGTKNRLTFRVIGYDTDGSHLTAV